MFSFHSCWAALLSLALLIEDSARGAPLVRRSQRQTCQVFSGSPNLDDCPSGTVYVSATDSKATYKTIQAAVNSLSSSGSPTILIGKGTYHEQVTVSRSEPVTFLGQTSVSTSSSTDSGGNLVRITWSKGVHYGDGVDNRATSVLYVKGCSNFKSYNVDLYQLNGPGAVALALAVDSSQASFYGSDLAGYQDTVYIGRGANVFIWLSTIRGATDYLFGYGTLWVEASTLANRAAGYITAWKGTAGRSYGAYISNSAIQRSSDVGAFSGQLKLGRPWNSAARTVYLSCSMDSTVLPAGFSTWNPNDQRLSSSLYFAEFGSSGSGWTPSQRKFITGGASSIDANHLEFQLNASQAGQWTQASVFKSVGTSWIDYSY